VGEAQRGETEGVLPQGLSVEFGEFCSSITDWCLKAGISTEAEFLGHLYIRDGCGTDEVKALSRDIVADHPSDDV
jgi:hypothetical protein